MLEVLNESFTHKEVPTDTPYQADFVANLPIMWTKEHDYPCRHLAVKENGRIVSLLGIYPLPAVIDGEKVLIGTIGNIASLPAARGRGYMKQLPKSMRSPFWLCLMIPIKSKPPLLSVNACILNQPPCSMYFNGTLCVCSHEACCSNQGTGGQGTDRCH